MDSTILKSILIHLIPSAITYCRICDGDARVIIMFSLRKFLPSLSSEYFKSNELHNIFTENILLNLPVVELLQDNSPIPQLMIRLLSEISAISDECCQDITQCLITKHQVKHEPILQTIFQLLRSNFLEKSSSSNLRSQSPTDTNPSDPQIIILLRQLLSSKVTSSTFYYLLLREEICQIITDSILFSIRKLNSEFLLVILDFLYSFLQFSQQEMNNPKLNILSSISVLQSIIIPFMEVLNWNLLSSSMSNVDPSIIFLIQDSILKSLLLFVELIPETLVDIFLEDKQSSQRFSRILLNEKVRIL